MRRMQVKALTMTWLWKYLFNYRLRALIKKEFAEIRHDRRMTISLVFPPVVHSCCWFG